MDTPETFHFEHERRVEFADTDMAGIVHFSNFFRFVESAEHAFFRSLGQSVHDAENHTGWPRVHCECDFLRPIRFEDVMLIRLRIEQIRSSTLRYQFWMTRKDDPAAQPLAAGRMIIACVRLDAASGQIKAIPIPDELRTALDNTAAL